MKKDVIQESPPIATHLIKQKGSDKSSENDDPDIETKETAPPTNKSSPALKDFVTSNDTASAELNGPVFHESISVTRVPNEVQGIPQQPEENFEV